jgi:shikimate kinase
MKIFLIGLPGSGKTTLGKQLAKILKLKLIDLDISIEKARGTSIPEIFKTEGEDEFRVLEKKALHHSFTQDNVIISTGGGAPCFFDNMDQMNTNGTTLFIDVTPKELINRMNGDGQANRPLLAGKTEKELKTEIEEKRIARLPFYSQANYTVTGDNIILQDLLDVLT